MSGNEATEDKGHGDGSRETHPNKQEELEPYRPQADPVSPPPPSGQQWCYCGSVPPPTHPYGIVCVQYYIIPTIDSQSRSDHPAHGGHRASTEDTGHQGADKVEMQHSLQPMQPNPPMPQPWSGFPHSGYLPVPPLCYCGKLPPHHHPGGMVNLPYPNIPPEDNRSTPDHPTHGGQHAVSTEGKGHHGAGKVEMQHTIQQMQPNPPVPQPEYGYPYCGYLPVPPLCYCGNIPPHHHPNGMVYMSYPNKPPADLQSRTEYPTRDAQFPSIEDNGHHRAGRSQMQFAAQQVELIPPAPQPWSENPHSGYPPVPSLCYCGNIPPHHHPGGMVYMSHPNRPPAVSEYLKHGGQPASTEDKRHHGTGMVEMHHATHMKPPVPQPWNGYPHNGYLPAPPVCYCGKLPPHHHPHGSVYVPYPDSPPTGSQSRSDHPNHCGQHPVSVEDNGHHGADKVEMQHALQQMQPNHPMPQPWLGYPPCGYQPSPSLCYCCNIPPHPGGMALMSYPSRFPEDSQPKTEYPNHDRQDSPSAEHTENQRVVTSQMNHTTQPMQPHSGYLPVPPLCYCCNLPPHHHPNGIVHVPYSHMPPADGQP